MRRVALLGLAVAAVALAGCGGGGGSSSPKPLTKAEYQAKIAALAKEVGASIGSTTNSKMISQADADKVAKGLRSIADGLDKLTPPTEVKDLHVQLVAVMRQLGDAFPGIADKLRKAKDPTAFIDAFLGAPAVQKLIKLGNDFKAKGYNLDLNG